MKTTIKEVLFIKTKINNSIKNLIDLGFEVSELCNDGIFTVIDGKKIMYVNHIPYKKHIEFNSENELLNYIIKYYESNN